MPSSDKNVIYEVNIKAQNIIADDLYNWLKNEHISDMLKLDGFLKANLLIMQGKEEDNDYKYFSVVYYILNKTKLDEYFKIHAVSMRSGGLAKFGDKFSAERRIFTIDEEYISNN